MRKGNTMIRILLGLLALTFAVPAQAMTDASATVETTAAVELAAGSGSQPRRNIHIINRSTNNIWCSWTGTATVAGAGTFPLLGQGASIVYGPPGLVPNEALSCISSGASSGLTILTVP